MKGFAKRLGLLAACVLLVCATTVTASAAVTENCPGECAHQAAVGTTHYDTLEEAVTAAPSGGSVTLLTDLTVSTGITVDKSLTVDLGGKTLTVNQAPLQFTKGGAVRNGKLTAAQGNAVQVKNCTVAIDKSARLEGCGSAPVLTLSATAKVNIAGTLVNKGSAPVIESAYAASGTCELNILKNADISAESNPAISLNCAGKLTVSGGTITTKSDAIKAVIHDKQALELAVTGGKILSGGEAIAVTTEGDAVSPKDCVTGGTFKKVPTAFVPDYCKIKDNSDGTYTVISSYVLTFQPGDGSGSMDAVKVRCGSTGKLPKCGFTAPKGKDFAGWDIGGKTYKAGAKFTPEDDTTVTALWKDHVHSGGKATCQKKAVCKGCGKSYGTKGSHDLSTNGGYAATCTEDGMCAHSKCGTCGKYFVSGVAISASDLALPALGHNWEAMDGKPATCTEDGLRAHEKCANCGLLQAEGTAIAEEDLLIAATGHTMEAVAASQATCAEPGIQAHEHCTVCGSLFLKGENVEITQLTTALSSHVLSDWENDAFYHWKACVDCQEIFRQSSHADKDADGSCDDCGYTLPVKETTEESGFGFSWLFLIPIIAAVAIAVPLAAKKRK